MTYDLLEYAPKPNVFYFRTKNPNAIKKDCIVLDFGISLLKHGDLETDILLDDVPKGEMLTKPCPSCKTDIPINCRICPICGYDFPKEEGEGTQKTIIEKFKMTPIELIGDSPFKWINLFPPSEQIKITIGFDAWAVVCSKDLNVWFAIGGIGKNQIKKLYMGDELQALSSADDFMRENETNKSAKKTAKWMMNPSTVAQDNLLKKFGYAVNQVTGSGYTKGEAAAHITFKFNRNKIEYLMRY